jgi:hypothetical protein
MPFTNDEGKKSLLQGSRMSIEANEAIEDMIMAIFERYPAPHRTAYSWRVKRFLQ